MLKTCAKCGGRGDFYIDAQKRDGLDSWCKPCRKASSLKTRRKFIVKVQEYDRKRRHGRYVANKDHEMKRNKAWVKSHPKKVKAYRRRRSLRIRVRLYGLTPLEFACMAAIQDYKCAICRVEILERNVQHIDHDHKTNKVRAILCQKCNRGLGHFNDDPVLLDVAAAYLRGYSETF